MMTGRTTMEEDEALARAIHSTFATPEGRVTLTWLLDRCGIFERRPDRIMPDRISLIAELMDAGHMAVAGNADIFASALLASFTAER